MENILEFLMPISMLITAVLLLALNIIEEKQEAKEKKLREAKAAHEEIKKRWKEIEKQ